MSRAIDSRMNGNAVIRARQQGIYCRTSYGLSTDSDLVDARNPDENDAQLSIFSERGCRESTQLIVNHSAGELLTALTILKSVSSLSVPLLVCGNTSRHTASLS